MSLDFAIDVIGWLGAGSLLLAYVLLSMKRLDGQSTTYQVLNLGGAIGLILNSGYYGAYPSALLNVIWAGIGVATLFHVWRTMRKNGPRNPD